MSERDELLASIASTIKTYRAGELVQPTSAYVDRWVRQFTPANQLPFLREFDHVMRQTFLTKEAVSGFLANLVRNEKLAGKDPKTYWADANILSVQKAGQSQKEMVKLFAETLKKQCGLKLANCGAKGGDYIYLDDVLFTGGRVATDLQAWITGKAYSSSICVNFCEKLSSFLKSCTPIFPLVFSSAVFMKISRKRVATRSPGAPIR